MKIKKNINKIQGSHQYEIRMCENKIYITSVNLKYFNNPIKKKQPNNINTTLFKVTTNQSLLFKILKNTYIF